MGGPVKPAVRNRSWTICVLNHDGSDLGFRHYLFAEIIEGFRSVMERHGYDIVFISGQLGRTKLSYYEHCRHRNADGVFIVYADYNARETRELIESDLPKIAIDHADASIGCVMTDCDKSMELLYGRLYALGHRNVAYMHGEPIAITRMRLEGLRKAMERRGMRLTGDSLIESKYYCPESGYESFQKLLARRNRPTAVIASDDYSAVGALRAARDMGLSVPEDISVAGFDGIELTQMISPPLTTIRQDTLGMGTKAAESLIKQILGVHRGRPESIVLEPQLLPGGTCGKRQ